LYKKIDLGINLFCVTQEKAYEIMKEVYGGEYISHPLSF